MMISKNTMSTYGDRINIHEYYEVEYWTKTLDISVEQLRKAVATAGTSVNEVVKYLGK